MTTNNPPPPDLAQLRREIESLLSFDEQAADFIETPPEDIAAAIFTKKPDETLIGKTLNHYRVLSILGAGGMGEVYLAEDTRLDRRKALRREFLGPYDDEATVRQRGDGGRQI